MERDRASRGEQVARSFALAAFAATTSGVTHVLAGGHAPTGSAFLLVLAVLAVVGVPLVGGSPGALRSFSLLAVMQVLAHAGSELAAAATPVTPRGGGQVAAVVLARHGHGARPPSSRGTALASTVDLGSSHSGLLPGPTMLAAHVVAALLLVVALTWCERSWAAAVGLLRVGALRFAELVVAFVVASARLLIPLRRLTRPTVWAFTPDRMRTRIWSGAAPALRGPPRLVSA